MSLVLSDCRISAKGNMIVKSRIRLKMEGGIKRPNEEEKVLDASIIVCELKHNRKWNEIGIRSYNRYH